MNIEASTQDDGMTCHTHVTIVSQRHQRAFSNKQVFKVSPDLTNVRLNVRIIHGGAIQAKHGHCARFSVSHYIKPPPYHPLISRILSISFLCLTGLCFALPVWPAYASQSNANPTS
jgi:hypothetical protein